MTITIEDVRVMCSTVPNLNPLSQILCGRCLALGETLAQWTSALVSKLRPDLLISCVALNQSLNSLKAWFLPWKVMVLILTSQG